MSASALSAALWDHKALGYENGDLRCYWLQRQMQFSCLRPSLLTWTAAVE